MPKSENGRMPALEDPTTGVVSWESGAIMNYVRRVYDKDNKINPRGPTVLHVAAGIGHRLMEALLVLLPIWR
jgi:glutathione S-transferase